MILHYLTFVDWFLLYVDLKHQVTARNVLSCLNTVGAVRNFVWIHAGQTYGIEQFSISASEKSRVSIHAGDQPAAITWHGESWIGPELSSGTVGGELVRALEAYYRFRIAQGNEFVRPDARVGFVIVDEAGVTVGPMWLAVDTLDVSGAARVTIRIHAELILAARAADRRVVGLAIVALNSPIIIAVIMDGTVSVKQKSILAVFEA